MEFSAQIDTRQLNRAFNAFPQQLRSNLSLGLKIHSRYVQEEARRKHRFTSRSGATELSIENRVNERDLTSRIGINKSVSPHGGFVHDGTKPHVIRRKNKKVLRYVKNGKFHFAKKVNHPGTRPDPFIENSAEKLKPAFNSRINQAVEKAAKGAGF